MGIFEFLLGLINVAKERIIVEIDRGIVFGGLFEILGRLAERLVT